MSQRINHNQTYPKIHCDNGYVGLQLSKTQLIYFQIASCSLETIILITLNSKITVEYEINLDYILERKGNNEV
jgi:hypothetical protein